MGQQHLNLTGAAALEFPLHTLSKQFTNLFSAIPLVYYGCSTSVKDVVKNQLAVNAELTIHEVCTALHSSTSYASIDAKYLPYIKQTTFDKYNKPIGLLKTEDDKQLACLVAADLHDPKTGYNGIAGYLCPSWVTFQNAQVRLIFFIFVQHDSICRFTGYSSHMSSYFHSTITFQPTPKETTGGGRE